MTAQWIVLNAILFDSNYMNPFRVRELEMQYLGYACRPSPGDHDKHLMMYKTSNMAMFLLTPDWQCTS